MRAREVSSSNDDWARYDIQAAHSYDSSDLELTDLRVWQGVTQSTSNSSIVIQTDSTGAVGATNFDLHRPGQNAQSIKEWRSLADELPHRNGHLYCHEHAVREGLPRKQRDLLYGRMLSAQMVAMHLRRKLGCYRMAIKALQDPLACSVDYHRFPKHQVGPPQHAQFPSRCLLAAHQPTS